MAGVVKYSPYRQEDLSLNLRTHAKKPGMVTHTWDPSVRKVATAKALTAAGPATLAYLVSSKPVRDLIPKMVAYNTQGRLAKAAL